MEQDQFIEKQERVIAIHVFSVSAGLVGVCLTVIGILNVIIKYGQVQTIGDDVTCVAAIIFLTSCFLAYISMRTRDRQRGALLEKAADVIFLSGLTLMAFICCLIVYMLNR